MGLFKKVDEFLYKQLIESKPKKQSYWEREEILERQRERDSEQARVDAKEAAEKAEREAKEAKERAERQAVERRKKFEELAQEAKEEAESSARRAAILEDQKQQGSAAKRALNILRDSIRKEDKSK